MRGVRSGVMLVGIWAAACGPMPDPMSEPAGVPDVAPTRVARGALTQVLAGGERRWRDELKLDISYCVDAGFGADRDQVVGALAAATADWSQDVQIAFRYVDGISDCTSSPDVRLHVIPGASYACTTPTGTSYSYPPRT